MKSCKVCKKLFKPRGGQYKRQLYCTRKCKDKQQRLRDKMVGSARIKKGGYPRSTILRLFLKAREGDRTIPCFYCNSRLTEETFVIDHKRPVKDLKTREEYLREDNLVISCGRCNQLKGSMPFEEWMRKKSKN